MISQFGTGWLILLLLMLFLDDKGHGQAIPKASRGWVMHMSYRRHILPCPSEHSGIDRRRSVISIHLDRRHYRSCCETAMAG